MYAIACAPTDNRICWSEIFWDKCTEAVKKLQKRIVKAQKEGRYNKVKSSQWLITHSFYAKVIEKGMWQMHKDDKTNKKHIVHLKFCNLILT